jgi:hypothetical protein
MDNEAEVESLIVLSPIMVNCPLLFVGIAPIIILLDILPDPPTSILYAGDVLLIPNLLFVLFHIKFALERNTSLPSPKGIRPVDVAFSLVPNIYNVPFLYKSPV